jgi:type II secretory pathway pseudopilin PulG
MNGLRHMKDNNGFSLIELIVIIAIMVIMVGMGGLAMSLLTGSDAKQAAEKIGSQLDEAKTGAMSRYDEDLNIIYVDNPDDYDWADKQGFYAVKQITTMGKSGAEPIEVPLGNEHRYLCNSRVSMQLNYEGGSYNLAAGTGGGFGFAFNRADGLYKGVKTGCSISGSGQSAPVSSTTVDAQPESLAITSGLRTYTIRFHKDTGKHTIEK